MFDNANAIRLTLFTIAIYVAALTVGLRLLYYLAYVLAGVLVAAFIWAQLNRRGLKLRRQLQPPQAQVGQIVQEIVEVHNLFWLPKLWLEVRDRSTLPRHQVGAVVSLKGRGAKRWRVRTRCTHRGLYHVGPTAILTGDPFGLFRVSRVFDDSSELLVYPPTVPLASFGIPEGELPGGTQTQRRAYHTTPNAAGLRDYLPGDPMNRIHWPASARTQRLMVKEFELDPTADLWVVLDLHEDVHVSCPRARPSAQHTSPGTLRAGTLNPVYGGRAAARKAAEEEEHLQWTLDPSTEEYAVAVAASVCAYLIGQGRSVGFIAWGQHRVLLPADRGGRQLLKILRALAVLRAEGTTSLEELIVAESRQFGRQDTLIVITPSVHEEWVAAVATQRNKGIRALSVIIEPGTFCGPDNALLVVGALTALAVPTYLVKRDDTIDASLSQAYAGSAARNLR
jgi:uncharacterized protein (DUF58 family)